MPAAPEENRRSPSFPKNGHIKILYLRFIVSAPSPHLQPSAVLQPAEMFSINSVLQSQSTAH